MAGYQYKELPISFRIAQRSMLIALISGLYRLSHGLANGIAVLRSAFLIFLAACISSAMLAMYYVVIRYPFLGILYATDGDLFHRNYRSTRSTRILIRVLNCVAIIMFVLLPVGLLSKPVFSIFDAALCVYSIILVAFLWFLAFRYDRISHPTIATYIRASFGIGIVLFPLFIPAIVAGSLRCSSMLKRIESGAPP